MIHGHYSAHSDAPVAMDGLVIEHRVKDTRDYRTEDVAIRRESDGETVFEWHHGYGYFAPGADYEDSGTGMQAVKAFVPGEWERSFKNLYTATRPLAKQRAREGELRDAENEKRRWGL